MTEEIILEEGFLGKAMVAGAIGIAGLTAHQFIKNHPMNPDTGVSRISTGAIGKMKSDEERKTAIAKTIQSKYKHIDPQFARQVAHLAVKHEHAEFPRAEDIAAISGIESSFDPSAKSKLKYSPAIGLTQIRPEIWGLKKKDLATPEQQIKKSVEILSSYHSKLGHDTDSTIHSYNVGISNFRKGKGLNPGYVEKFKKERALYDDHE